MGNKKHHIGLPIYYIFTAKYTITSLHPQSNIDIDNKFQYYDS